jgi:hypothetical protein
MTAKVSLKLALPLEIHAYMVDDVFWREIELGNLQSVTGSKAAEEEDERRHHRQQA